MRTVLAMAIIAALVAVAAWALSSSEPAGSPYTVEVRDVAGEPTLIVVPEVVVTAPGHLVMPEVVVHATAEPEIAGLPASGFEVLN